MRRREFLIGATSAAAAMPGRGSPPPEETAAYANHGRTADYRNWRIIERGRTIVRIETFVKEAVGLVRLTTQDGRQGLGQMSSYDADLTALFLHRRLAPQVLGQDAADIDLTVDRCIDANHKFPWSFACRGLAGIDTALWDLYGKLQGKPVCELLGGKCVAFPVYGSSMRRDISPEDEASRLVKLRDEHGFQAFKIRVGQENGHNRDASPGRTEKLIPAVRKALGPAVRLKADANGCYTPPRAIEVGRLMQDHGYVHYEEPCPYWELEWTAEVAAALTIDVTGGEQDNDLAQWRRMIRMNAVDVVQPDIGYIGGITRAWRVGRLAAQARKKVVPHSANLSMVTLFSLHLMAALPNAGAFVEYTIEWDNAVNRPFYKPVLSVRDGRVQIPDGPGWGIEIDPAWLAAAQYQKSEKPA